jgi:uncharacterized membrane protein
MKKYLALATAAVAVSSLAGCKAKEIAETQIAEALATQAISGYHQAAVNLTINNHSFSVSCAQGGTLDWSEKDDNGTICYSTESKECTFEVQNASLTLAGPYTVCGYPVAAEDSAGAEDLDGQTLTITGSVSASTENLATRQCDYSLTMSNMKVTGADDSLTVTTDITGTMCGKELRDLGVSVSVSGSISASGG